MNEEHRGRLIIYPPNLHLSGDVRHVTLPDDDRVRQTWAEIDRRAFESYERSCQDHMSVLEMYGNMPLN